MSLLLSPPLKLCFRKPVLVRSSPLVSNGFSSSLPERSPCVLISADPCGGDRGRALIRRPGGHHIIPFEEFEQMMENDNNLSIELGKELGTIGSSNGWLPSLKDGVLRFRDMNLNPGSVPKRISLLPLVTLPHCQTQYITIVAMSSSSPEEEDCVVAVKFLGPQISFCRPAHSNSEWTNIRIQNPCFFSSPVMFSKKHDMFRILGSGGHLIASWNRCKHSKNPKLQTLRFQNLPKMTKAKRDLLDSCYTSELLVESTTTGETFMVKWYKMTANIIEGIPRMKTEVLMVFKLDEEGNAVYTQDIGDQSIFLTTSEALCDPFSYSLCHRQPNYVKILDVDHKIINVIKLADQKWNRPRHQSPTLDYRTQWVWACA